MEREQAERLAAIMARRGERRAIELGLVAEPAKVAHMRAIAQAHNASLTAAQVRERQAKRVETLKVRRAAGCYEQRREAQAEATAARAVARAAARAAQRAIEAEQRARERVREEKARAIREEREERELEEGARRLGLEPARVVQAVRFIRGLRPVRAPRLAPPPSAHARASGGG